MSLSVIMVSAQQQGGKSTLCEELKRRAHKNKDNRAGIFDFVAVDKFAHTLYGLHDYILNKMEIETGVPRIKKDGDLLQLLGTEWGRTKLGDNVWCDILRKRVLKSNGLVSSRLVLIDDCRFENEFDIFPEALRIRLECPEDVRKARSAPGVWRDKTDHPSETGLDKYAAAGKFDLYFYTDPADSRYIPLDGMVSLILAQLQKGRWTSERKV